MQTSHLQCRRSLPRCVLRYAEVDPLGRHHANRAEHGDRVAVAGAEKIEAQAVRCTTGISIGMRESLLGLLFIPVAALGVTVFAFPYWLTGQIGRRAPDLSSRATWKVVGGALLYGVWIVGISTLVALWGGNRAAAISAGGLTLLAFGGLLAFEREAAVFRTAAAFVALRQTPLKARARLNRQRAALATVLEQVGEWVRSV